MATLENQPIPSFAPEEARIFLAEDSSAKRDSIIRSLEEFGLGHSVTVATSMGEALEYVDGQIPHELDFNVFLLDGSLDPKEHRILRDGTEIAYRLFNRYQAPFMSVVDQASLILKELGLTARQRKEVMAAQHLSEIVLTQLQSEALIAGISSVDSGRVRFGAQLPLIDYKNAGQVVYETAVPAKIRRSIERQKDRQEHLSRLAARPE